MAETTERIEYRVVGNVSLPGLLGDGAKFVRSPVSSRKLVGREVEFEKKHGSENVRIQSRTVTETPWVDLDEQEGQ